MKRAAQSKATRELDSITTSFVTVRILHRASAAPVTAEQLQPLAHARLLAKMTRSGVLRAKAATAGQAQPARQYSLTPKGRRLLATATKHLRQLAAPQFTKHKENRKQS